MLKYNLLESFKEQAEVDNEMPFRKGLLTFLFHNYVRMSTESAFRGTNLDLNS